MLTLLLLRCVPKGRSETGMAVNFQALMASGLEQLDLDVSKENCKRLEIYFSELKKWAKKVNLIAKNSSDEQIIEKHFLDSLMILPFLKGSDNHLLDVGTGAGFPGLVCKVAMPELRLTLVEPRLKRVSFLNHIVRTLDLDGVTSLSCRIEDDEQLTTDGGFSHITSRAVADIETFLNC